MNSIIKQDENINNNYGDIISESTKKNEDDSLMRGMTDKEITYFKEIKENNMNRIYENCGNNINNDYKFDKPRENMMISGIGKVTQMM